MWWECAKIQQFLLSGLHEISKITKQQIEIIPELVLFNIFQYNNANLLNKELICHLLSAARNMARYWKNLSWVNVDNWHKSIWDIALLEKLRNKLPLLREQKDNLP